MASGKLWWRPTVAVGIVAAFVILPLPARPVASAAKVMPEPVPRRHVAPEADVARLPFARAAQVRPPRSSHLPQGTGLFAVDCTARAICVAGGNYELKNGQVQALVLTRSGGRWARAVRLSLPRNAAVQPYAQVNGIACTRPGYCVAVGSYIYNAAHDALPFLATERHGRWSRAIAPRLPANSAAIASAKLSAVACTPAGFCEAVGSYRDRAGGTEAMAVTKAIRGRWRQAGQIAAPLHAAANPGAVMTGVACVRARSCVAVGSYSTGSGRSEAMGAIEVSGRWHRALAIPSPPGAVASSFTAMTSISCRRDRSCLAVGEYAVTPSQDRAMFVTEANGRFGAAFAMTSRPAGAGARPSTALSSVSCPAAGPCAAVGVATNRQGEYVAMDATWSGGRWLPAFLAQPADSARKYEQSSLFSVDCPGRAQCTAVGYYNDNAGGYRAEAASTR